MISCDHRKNPGPLCGQRLSHWTEFRTMASSARSPRGSRSYEGHQPLCARSARPGCRRPRLLRKLVCPACACCTLGCESPPAALTCLLHRARYADSAVSPRRTSAAYHAQAPRRSVRHLGARARPRQPVRDIGAVNHLVIQVDDLTRRSPISRPRASRPSRRRSPGQGSARHGLN